MDQIFDSLSLTVALLVVACSAPAFVGWIQFGWLGLLFGIPVWVLAGAGIFGEMLPHKGRILIGLLAFMSLHTTGVISVMSTNLGSGLDF